MLPGRRTAVVALLVLAMVGSLLALAVPPPSVAGAQDPPPGVTSTKEWWNDCLGRAGGFAQPQRELLGVTVTAPTQVAPDETFTIRLQPTPGLLPDTTFNDIVGLVTVLGLQDIRFMYNLPTNSQVQSVSIVPGTWSNVSGTPTVSVDSSFSPSRIVMRVPQVLKNPSLPDNVTPFQLPAIDVVVQATGAVGSNVATRMSGFNDDTSGYTFLALNDKANADVTCWPEGEIPAPLLSQTAIVSGGGETQPTTTELTVDPTVLPGGYQANLTATVTAPNGAVRFNDGATVLGFAELDEDGTADLVATLNNVGQRQITASFLGSPGFDTSTSEPVAVTVTNPANREPVQLTVAAIPTPTTFVGSAVNTPRSGLVSVSVDQLGGGSDPSGEVSLFVDGALLETRPLVDGSADFTTFEPWGGYELRAAYSGDTTYFPGSGKAPLVMLPTPLGTGTDTVDRVVTGSIGLNGASGAVPPASEITSPFRTDGGGMQTLQGVLYFPQSTLPVSGGGSITGQLAVLGLTEGSIAAGSDAEANMSASMFFVVSEADFDDGAGTRSFASTCSVGPFDVELTGDRDGTSGPLELDGAGFPISFPATGSCIDGGGISRAMQVGSVLSGGATALSLDLTPPAAGAATEIIGSVSVNPAGGASFGQPVTLSATMQRVGGSSLPFGGIGTIEFYANGGLVGSANASSSGVTRTANLTVPATGLAPLPQGDLDLQARFVPSNAQKNNLATSALSASAPYTVLPAIAKVTPTLTLDVPEAAQVTEPVTLTLTLDPAPNTAPGAANLAGEIRIYDRTLEEVTEQQIPITASLSTIQVSSSSDGTYVTETALAPGLHELEAVFVPSIASEWGWTPAFSERMSHTVVGEAIPTELSIVSDSTRGTGQIPLGQQGWVEIQIDPAVVASTGPFSAARLGYDAGGASIASVALDARGRGVVEISSVFTNQVGPGELLVDFDPGRRAPDGLPWFGSSNQGFAPSQIVVPYEVVNPASTGPIPMDMEITAAAPNRAANPPVLTASEPIPANTPWGLDGYVSYVGSGNPNGGKVDYVARNTATAEITALGAAGVRAGTGATDRGRASIPSTAQSGFPAIGNAPGLPAGTYEVWGTYTPNSPSLYQSASSESFIVTVLADGETIDTETTLSVTPSGTSEPGQGVLLEAHVSPGEAVGTVEFFDGETSLGTAPLAGGVASMLIFDLAEGEHQLSAVFTSSSPLVESSNSLLIPHLVAEPSTPTETVLTVSPEGTSLQGENVTLTATVTPEDAVGTVIFEDEHGELGSAELVDGEAVLVIGDLEPGTHEIVAVFEPDPESDFAGSSSEPVVHEVIAQGVPAPPLDITAEPGGLMATVSWDAPEDDGGQPITGYTVYISSGVEPEEWDVPVADVTAAVTTVDVIGLEADTDYTFKVTAHNAEGESDLSEVSNTVTVGPAEHEFTDVGPGDDFFNEITWMAETGLSTGYEPGPEFRPTISITRQAMSAFIYRINGSPLGDDPQCTTMPFPDVSLDNDFCGEIAWMADEGITQGNSDGTFNPTGAVSRQAMSAFLYRSANGPDAPPACTEAPFSDVPVADDFCPYIAWMKAEGISTGDPEGTFRPTLPVTRMAMSAFLYRYTLVVPTSVV